MRKRDVAKKVDTLIELADRSLVWVECEPSFAPEPLFNEGQKPSKLGWVVGENDSVVGVAYVVLHSKLVFDKVIECVQINIRK